MSQRNRDFFLGIAIITLGILIGLERVSWLILRSWWPIIVIIPCGMSMFYQGITRIKAWSFGIGAVLLITRQFAFLEGLGWPLTLIVVGVVFLWIPKREKD